MKMGAHYYRRCIAAVRLVALLLLVSALLAPKVSLAMAATFGSGYSTVIICTGSGLARVSVSPQGDVVEDVSSAWASAHCVLQDERTVSLQRGWENTAFPAFVAVAHNDENWIAGIARQSLRSISNRGPPALR